MPKPWLFLENRRVVRERTALLVPIVNAVLGGLWAGFMYVFALARPEEVAQPPGVTSGQLPETPQR
jgi:hypothetical protein